MGWWRINRWWLLVLPVCLAALVLAASYRVQHFWYDTGLHHAVAKSSPGQTVSVSLGYEDAYGSTERTFRARLAKIGSRTSIPARTDLDQPIQAPAGDQVVTAQVDWSADPDQVLSGCNVAIVDDQGRRYETPVGTPQLEFCVPEEHPGPDGAFTKEHPRGYVDLPSERRPPTWSTTVYFFAPKGIHISRLLIWYARPDYVELTAP